ncbi:MAG: adenylosuccinate lyase [Elusimicrobia bacterium CG08_land_8_20_14_0_20_51_18]|nr:MAG: adenylosuccinate lyase [Elusimicrobia bacterium CG08_land_8_20_14_0_20_51_18]
MEKLQSINPIDGRYRNRTEDLSRYFSEEALINFRIVVECEYFIFLLERLSKKDRRVKPLKKAESSLIRELYLTANKNAFDVKQLEFKGDAGLPATNHDVKAVEYYLKKNFKNSSFRDRLEFFHFGLTSEDVNNIAYSLMIDGGLREILLPEAEKLLKTLKGLALKHAGTPLLARTHGQPAVGTTFGKEFRIFYERLKNQLDAVKKHAIKAKLNGAVGNYNAHISAYPAIDWVSFSGDFLKRLGENTGARLEVNLFTTQIESHDSWVELFDRLRHINSILTGFSQDIWRYVSDELIIQRPVKGEVGSSTMPHKVNPIDFENAEGNFGLANSLFAFFSAKLPVSRLQRDLSDSTVERNIGSAFAYSLIGYRALLKGLEKIEVNSRKSAETLEKNPQIYAEALQTVLRRERVKNPYELLKGLTRGKKPGKTGILKFIRELKTGGGAKKELRDLLSRPYTGLAEKLAKYKL